MEGVAVGGGGAPVGAASSSAERWTVYALLAVACGGRACFQQDLGLRAFLRKRVFAATHVQSPVVTIPAPPQGPLADDPSASWLARRPQSCRALWPIRCRGVARPKPLVTCAEA
eukprot:355077-Chlamydomonas_euryale.AAC.13